MFYAVKLDNAGRNRYLMPKAGCSTDALRFATVGEALKGYAAHGHRHDQNVRIVRVEETPGKTQRMRLGELEKAPAGATVKYALTTPRSDEYLTVPALPFHNWTSGLDSAALFSTHANAIFAFGAAQKSTFDGAGYSCLEDMAIVRVALVTTPVTFSETVVG